MFSEINMESVACLIEEKHQLQQRVALLEYWVESLINNNSLIEFCHANEIKNVAIYSYGKYGKLLEKMLMDTDITLKYVIDRNKNELKSVIPMYSLNDELPCVDAVIIATIGIDINEVTNIVRGSDFETKVFSVLDIFQCQNVLN